MHYWQAVYWQLHFSLDGIICAFLNANSLIATNDGKRLADAKATVLDRCMVASEMAMQQ